MLWKSPRRGKPQTKCSLGEAPTELHAVGEAGPTLAPGSQGAGAGDRTEGLLDF